MSCFYVVVFFMSLLFTVLSCFFCFLSSSCVCMFSFFCVFQLYSIYGKNSTNDNCFAPIIMVTLTYLSVYEIYKTHKNCPNYMKLLHHEICDLLKIEYVTVNRVSLNKDKLNRYFENIFMLSRPCQNDSREGIKEFGEKTDELLKEKEKLL